MKKLLFAVALAIGLTSLVQPISTVPTAKAFMQDICSTYDGAPVIWEGVELTNGVIGKVFILKDTPLYKFNGTKKVVTKTLKKGGVFKIYSYKGSSLGVGAGLYVNKDSKISYKTPSKETLALAACPKPKGVTLSMAEMENWINKEADLKRLNTYPIVHNIYGTLHDANQWELYHDGYYDNAEGFTKDRVKPAKEYMDVYFNRNYKTIGDAWIKNIRYYYRPFEPYIYNGSGYDIGQLPQMFTKMVQETKKDKIISESIFITDISLYYYMFKTRSDSGARIRGTQYIRYTSGSKLPKGVSLNKWYKRDIEVGIQSPMNEHLMKWDTSDWVFKEIYPITSYQLVKQ